MSDSNMHMQQLEKMRKAYLDIPASNRDRESDIQMSEEAITYDVRAMKKHFEDE